MGRTLFDAFSEEFLKEAKNAKSYPEAFNKASDKFRMAHGFDAFNSYDSFRKRNERKRKR